MAGALLGDCLMAALLHPPFVAKFNAEQQAHVRIRPVTALTIEGMKAQIAGGLVVWTHAEQIAFEQMTAALIWAPVNDRALKGK